jgi:hypothetical protein
MIGELTDRGMNDAGIMCVRIDDLPYECAPITLPYLERLEKGWRVEYHLNKEGGISKISRAPKLTVNQGDGFTTADKMKKAGFVVNQSATAPKETMSESEVAALTARAEEAKRAKAHAEEMAQKSKEAKEKPAPPQDKPLESGIKVVQGQITAYDAGAHSLTVKDIEGKHHEMMWKGPLSAKMEKLKQWFFVSISAEKSGDIWVVIDQTYYKKPDNWPVSQKSGYGGKPFTPRNEKIIVMQSSLKVCADLFQHCTASGTQDYDAVCSLVYAKALEMTDAIMIDTAGKVTP